MDSHAVSLANEYIDFLSYCKSPFHVVERAKKKLLEQGFEQLAPIPNEWELEQGKSYFVSHLDQKTLIAFVVGQESPVASGYSIFGAHTDSPVLRLKLIPWDQVGPVHRLLTQKHGGLILRSWLDRPLVLAGCVFKNLKKSKYGVPKIAAKLVETDQPIAVIPDLAIHLDREKNSNGSINAEQVMQAVFSIGEGLEEKRNALSDALGINLGDSDGFELSLAPYWPPVIVGADQSLIVGPCHDDLAMVFAGLKSLLAANSRGVPRTAVAAFFDAEETGSRTSSGADSIFFRDILDQITHSLSKGQNRGEALQARMESHMISADMAHALHPSYQSVHDGIHCPHINQGVVVKENANDAYATTGWGSAFIKSYAQKAQVPVQQFVARQDAGCGSTIGPICATKLGCRVIDVGFAMWGMHSSAETMGVLDLKYAVDLFSQYFLGVDS